MMFITSCKKENHSVRVRNLYPCDLANVKVGEANIGGISTGTNSSYYPISAGDFTINGVSTCGATLQGSGSITGKGKHQWTITVSTIGTIAIRED